MHSSSSCPAKNRGRLPRPSITLVIGLATVAFVNANRAEAATYNYDFGTGTGTFSTASGTSTSFLPATQTGGGTAYVRVGTGGGSLALENPGVTTLGSGSELSLTAPTNTSVNKFSIYDFGNATSLSTLSLSAYIAGTSGTFTLLTGNGATFSNASGFSGSETFAGLQFKLTSGTLSTLYRSGGNYVSTGLTTTGLTSSTVLNMQLIQNNSANQATYAYAGNSRTVAANSFDLYLNGSLIGDDLAKAQLATGTAIDSFMVYGESSSSPANNATFRVDDIAYTTDAQPAPEPMTAGLFFLAGGTILHVRRRARPSQSKE